MVYKVWTPGDSGHVTPGKGSWRQGHPGECGHVTSDAGSGGFALVTVDVRIQVQGLRVFGHPRESGCDNPVHGQRSAWRMWMSLHRQGVGRIVTLGLWTCTSHIQVWEHKCKDWKFDPKYVCEEGYPETVDVG